MLTVVLGVACFKKSGKAFAGFLFQGAGASASCQRSLNRVFLMLSCFPVLNFKARDIQPGQSSSPAAYQYMLPKTVLRRRPSQDANLNTNPQALNRG